MALNITRNKNAVVNKGGGELFVREINPETMTYPDSNVYDLGYIEVSDFKDTAEMEEINDETKNVVKLNKTNHIVQITATLLQSDANTLDISKFCRNKYFQIYYYMGKVDSNDQELVIPVAMINPSATLNSTNRKINIEITGLKISNNYDYSSGYSGFPHKNYISYTFNTNEIYKIFDSDIGV